MPTTYRLNSAAFVYAPGLIAWAINGYAFKRDRKVMVKIIADTWRLPDAAADALLSKRAPFRVEDETVIFEA